MNSKILYPAQVVAWLVAAGFTTPPPLDGDVGGSVVDSATSTPLPGGEVRILRGGNTIAATTTDPFGRYVIHNVPTGSYSVEVRYLGYRSEARNIAIGTTDALARADFRLVPLPINLSAVEVASAVPLAVDTRTGNQIFKQNDYHGAPTNTTSQILQQSIVGAARAPTGEVHIRGQHAEYTYYVDGVPVPAGVSGSLNELFDPQVVNQIEFQTGGWDAEYGNKNAAIVNVTTRIPTGPFHAELGSYVGAFDNSGWRHQFGGAGAATSPADLFAALFVRHGSLDFVPSNRDSAQFVFAPDPTAYNLAESRRFETYGTKLDYAVRPQPELEFK